VHALLEERSRDESGARTAREEHLSTARCAACAFETGTASRPAIRARLEFGSWLLHVGARARCALEIASSARVK
jgi:hypothetical protein